MSLQHQKAKKMKSKNMAKQLVIKACNQNSFGELVAFHKYLRNGLNSHLICKRVSELNDETKIWTFDLLKRNMQSMYIQSSWGWDEDTKKVEMTDAKSWYLIAFNENENPIAYSHFQYDIDYGAAVLYCYELHLEPECQRKGMGRFMLQILELLAFKAGLEKVILTVFLHNPAARSFFRNVGYCIDETSPVSSIEEQFDYEILSKHNKRKNVGSSEN